MARTNSASLSAAARIDIGEGMVKLKVGEKVYYKHVDELTREDRWARIAAEREEVAWLMERLGLRKDSS